MSDERKPGGIVLGPRPFVDIRPDPRLSNRRPGWLAGADWRAQLSAMADEDVEWIERHWDLTDGASPALDTSWVTTESAGDPAWLGWLPVLILAVALITAVVLGVMYG